LPVRQKAALSTLLVIVLAVAVLVTRRIASPEPILGPRRSPVGTFVTRLAPVDTPYSRWVEAERATRPTFSGLLIQDVRTHPLEYWPELGVPGLYIQMADYQITDGWILEIPPRGSTRPQRHLFEKGVYFFGGPGHTMLRQEGRPPQRVDWKARTLFSIPLNVTYQHFNDGDAPVRLVAVTSFPYIINSLDSQPFVFENGFAFRDRYDGDADYARAERRGHRNRIATNLVEDALAAALDRHDHRGHGATNMHWSMAGNTMLDLHVSQIPGRIYKRAHRHSSDAFILLLSGRGYSLTWAEGRYAERLRVDWHEGTLFVPPIYWYHQHLNPSAEPARYLAINAAMLVSNLGLRFEDQLEPDLDVIKQEFAREVETRQAQRPGRGRD
jgi:gentisate 1,2-dioxygenase